MKFKLWLSGRDRVSIDGKYSPADIKNASSVYRSFYAAAKFELDVAGNVITESIVTEPAPVEGARALEASNVSYHFGDNGVERKEAPRMVSDQITGLLSACNNTSTAYYNGFQYPLIVKLVKAVEVPNDVQITTMDYLVRNATELAEFLVDKLRPLIGYTHERLERSADRVIYSRLLTLPYADWRAFGEGYYAKAASLAKQGLTDRAHSNYSYAADFFQKAHINLKLDRHSQAPVVRNAFLQVYSAFIYEIMGTQDATARTEGSILLKMGLCKSKQHNQENLRHGLDEFKQAYLALYDAFGSFDAEVCEAKLLWEQAQEAAQRYQDALPRAAVASL